jgi:hypothetical protein
MKKTLVSTFVLLSCSIGSVSAAPVNTCDIKHFTYETFIKIKAGQTEQQVVNILKCNKTEKDIRSGANKLYKGWVAGEKHIAVEFLNGKVSKNSDGTTEKMGNFLEVDLLAKLPQKVCLNKHFVPDTLSKIKVGMTVSEVAKTIGCSPDKNAHVSDDRVSAEWKMGKSLSISVMFKNDGTVADDENGEAAIMSDGF